MLSSRSMIRRVENESNPAMFNSFVKISDREKRPNNGSATFVLQMLRVAVDQLGTKLTLPARQSGEIDV